MEPRNIEGFLGYAVTEDGEVFSARKGGFITQFTGNTGYKAVTIVEHDTGKARTLSVHRLVAKAFVENPDGLPIVSHMDGDKANNKASNLYWSTRSEAHKVAWATRSKKVICVETGKTFDSAVTASLSLGLHKRALSIANARIKELERQLCAIRSVVGVALGDDVHLRVKNQGSI